MTGESVVLESINVGPSYEITKLSELVKAQAKYDALPQSIRDVIDLSFYVVERRSRKIIIGPALAKIQLEIVTYDGKSKPLTVAKDGRVLISVVDMELPRGRIFSNAAKDSFDVDFRLSIKLPLGQPLTLGFLRASANDFLEAYKPYAGLVFRTFIGERKPNCFGMSFFEPQSVQALSPNSTTPLWTSPQGTRVTVFFSDIPTNDPSMVISWTGQVPPHFTTACLISRKSPH